MKSTHTTNESLGLTRRSFLALLVAASSLAWPTQESHAQAAAYPNRPITIVVPFSPGGPTDIVSRVVSVEMAKILGQPVIVENVPGANANLGAMKVMRAAPDGHTILASTWGNVIQPLVSKNAAFSLQTNFAPVSLLYTSRYLVLGSSTLPASNLEQVIAYAKANPGKVNFGIPGIKSVVHIALEHWNRQSGIKITNIPYKGEGDIVTALLTGDVQLGCISLVNATRLVKEGRLKTIATPSAARLQAFPDIPTFEEVGVRNIDIWNYNGFHVPAGTPRAVIESIHRAVVLAINSPDIKKRFIDMGGTAVGDSPAEYGAFIDGEVTKWRGIIKTLGSDFE